MKKLNCPNCGKELIPLEPFSDGNTHEFWCDDCNIDITITMNANDKKRDVKPGDIFRHFKGHIIVVLTVATHTETGEKFVIYTNEGKKVFARPYDMFMSEVDKEKYPDVEQKYRFKKIGHSRVAE